MESMFPACRRFANLYGYVRVLGSGAEQWANEPEWMGRLRAKLDKTMEVKAKQFGQQIK